MRPAALLSRQILPMSLKRALPDTNFMSFDSVSSNVENFFTFKTD